MCHSQTSPAAIRTMSRGLDSCNSSIYQFIEKVCLQQTLVRRIAQHNGRSWPARLVEIEELGTGFEHLLTP